ncbi:MAG: class I SAM-dependent methyltransferase [candidate division WOR-3 bacterium]|nr:class I SAM-dependent methyltransferase [candidate division WOR-3 bacterium]
MENDVKRWLREEGEAFLKDIGIRKGQTILDFGCGVGHYTIPAAKVTGKEGKVYAIDKDRDALEQLMQTAESEGLKNVVPIKTSGELKINLEDESADVVLLYDVLHYMNVKERREIYDEVYRILKSDGFFSVYPKHLESNGALWNFSRMELETIIKEIKRENFYFERKFFKSLIHNDNYDKGYILKFKKEREGN